MKAKSEIENSLNLMQSLALLLRMELKYHWNKFKQNNSSFLISKDIIQQDNCDYPLSSFTQSNNLRNNMTNTQIQSNGENSNRSGSFNKSLNKSNNSYQNILSKAIQDLKNDDGMFSYLHKELTKIKSPSICKLTKSGDDISPQFQLNKKQIHLKSKKKKINLIKKKFLLNDDEIFANSNTNMYFNEHQYYKYANNNNYKRYMDITQKDYNQTYTNVGSTDNSFLWKDKNNNSKPKVKYINQLNLSDLIQYETLSHYKLFINQIKQVACEFCNYSNLCYLAKVTLFHKYIHRLIVLHKIVYCWRVDTKINIKNRLKNQVLYKQMNSLLLCAIKGMHENNNIKQPSSNKKIDLR